MGLFFKNLLGPKSNPLSPPPPPPLPSPDTSFSLPVGNRLPKLSNNLGMEEDGGAFTTAQAFHVGSDWRVRVEAETNDGAGHAAPSHGKSTTARPARLRWSTGS